jgi:hypothetical protein
MVVINLALKNLLGGADDGFAAREHAIDGVTGVVPKGKADNLAAAVVPSEGDARGNVWRSLPNKVPSPEF